MMNDDDDDDDVVAVLLETLQRSDNSRTMSSVKAAKRKSRKRTHRYTSNVFSMFDQAQIHEFKVPTCRLL